MNIKSGLKSLSLKRILFAVFISMIIPKIMNFIASNINQLVKFLNKKELMLSDNKIKKKDILMMKKLLINKV